LIEIAAAESRLPIPASRIVLGLNCGGSDSFSGITANPALGRCSDWLAELGGTPVLAETTGNLRRGAPLVQRARNRQVAENCSPRFANTSDTWRVSAAASTTTPAPETRPAASPTSSRNRSARRPRAGSSPLIEVYDYAERIHNSRLRIHEHSRLRSRSR
jgi:altronate hydrolase